METSRDIHYVCSTRKQITANLINYKLNRAKARKTIKEAKKYCWLKYVKKKKLNSATKTESILENDQKNELANMNLYQ